MGAVTANGFRHMQAPPAHVALLGCGFAGTSALFQLVDRHPVKTVTVIEGSGRFGPGLPYRPEECPDYLVNNTTDTMCLVPQSRRAFVEWAKTRPDLVPALDEKGHLPRALYGIFLEDVVRAARTAAAIKGIEVRLVAAEATRLVEDADGRVRIGWAGGEVVADLAILTTGRCPPLDPYPHPPAGSPARYFPGHVMTAGLDDLPLDATAHVMGASLSAYDVINRLFAPATGCRFERGADGRLTFVAGPNQRRVLLCSRSGRLKSVIGPTRLKLDRRHFTVEGLRAAAGPDGLTLETVARLIRAEAEAHGATIDWRRVAEPYGGCATAAAVDDRAATFLETAIANAKAGGAGNFLVDFFADAALDIWRAFGSRMLRAEEERRYRRDFESAVLSYAAPCPIPTAERLLALIRAGRLSVRNGVTDVALAADGSHYLVGHAHGTERATVLVNTTGRLDRRVDSPRQPALIRGMVAAGLMRPYRLGGEISDGAAVDMETYRLDGCRNVYLSGMLLWGPGFFTSSAFLMATVVERILSRAFARG